MPTYIFDRDKFLDFVKKHLSENTVVIVSSDFADSKVEKIDSPVGKKDYFISPTHVSADIFRSNDAEDYDGMFRYVTIFCETDELTDEACSKVRKG